MREFASIAPARRGVQAPRRSFNGFRQEQVAVFCPAASASDVSTECNTTAMRSTTF